MSVIAPGTCRHCSCTEARPCRLQCGEDCCWVDRERMVCSRPSCITAESKRKAAARLADNAARRKPKIAAYLAMSRRGLSDDFIRAELERRARRRKGRAA